MRISVLILILNIVGFIQLLAQDVVENDYYKIAEAIRQEGHAFFNAKKYDLALAEYEDALQKFILIPDSVSIAKCYNNIANSHLFLGNNKEAVKAYYEAVEVNKRLGNSKNLTSNYINLAAYYKRQNEFDLALKYYQEANDEILKSNDVSRLPFIFLGFGDILGDKRYEQKNYILAKSYYKKALEKYIELKDSARVSSVFNNLGIVLSNQKSMDSSIFYYNMSLMYSKALHDERGQIVTYLNLGKANLDQGNYEIALEHFNKGSTLALEFEDDVNYLNIITNIIKCKINLGQTGEADSLFAIYNVLNDSIYNQENAKELKKLEVLYETKKIGNDLASQIQQTKENARLSNLYLLVAIGVFILLVITILFFMQRQRFQQKLKLQELDRLKHEKEIIGLNSMLKGQEDERNRIAEDLHDSLGARLSAIRLLVLSADNSIPKLADMLDESIVETREISHNLSTNTLTKFGLEYAIKDLLDSVNVSGKIKGEFISTNLGERFKKKIEKAIYYVVSELVNNTIKHAEASIFEIQITHFEGRIDLLYEDDGKGFEINEITNSGMGLSNLKARMESINGSLNIDTSPGNGVQVVAFIEMEEALSNI